MDEMTARERSGDPFYGEETTPVKLTVTIKECARCGGKFVPVSEKGFGSTHCPECRKQITEKAREKSLEARRSRKMETGLPCFSTTIKWYRPQDKMPEASCNDLFVMTDNGSLTTTSYSAEHNAFNAHDGGEGLYKWSAEEVAFWADVPQDLQNVMNACWKAWLNKRNEEE